jgi:hypothetical protein
MLKSARIQAVSSSSHHNDKFKLDLISVPNDLRRFRRRITHLLDPLDRASFSGNPGKFIRITTWNCLGIGLELAFEGWAAGQPVRVGLGHSLSNPRPRPCLRNGIRYPAKVARRLGCDMCEAARDATMAQRLRDAGVGRDDSWARGPQGPFLAERTQFHPMKSIVLRCGPAWLTAA